MIESLIELTGSLSAKLSLVILVALLGTGIYLSLRLGFVQMRGFGRAVRLLGRGGTADDGEVSLFQALSTSLSATVGTGNIAGVATAVTLGGPGALFWMWITAVLGMATRFAECTLAVRFREIDAAGHAAGGPMYTLAYGLKMHKTAIVFAACAMVASFGIGNMVQANSVVKGLIFIWPDIEVHRFAVGVLMAVLVALVIIGGVKRIAAVASRLVPIMMALYIGAAVVVLAMHAADIPEALIHIVRSAFSTDSVSGAVFGEAIRWGVARGLFSNEAGLGSSPMAYAATRTHEPVQAGLVSMLGPFIDTLVICTLTGLVIIVTGALEARPADIRSSALTAFAFSEVLGNGGAWVVGIGLTLFAYSTTIAWSYYGDRCAHFLFGERAVLPYRIVFALLIVVGAVFPLQLVWNIADITNILMAVPNLLSLLLLTALVKRLMSAYMAGGRHDE